MISAKSLTKTFGRTVAVNDISFEVARGEVVGLLGPNAAGKTTTMRMLTCYLAPDSGSATVAGFDVLEDSLEVRKRVGYLPESAPLYQDMDVVAYLSFIADIRGIPPAEKSRRIAKMVEVCGLGDMIGRTVGTLSKGFKQRVGLAQTLIHDPEILVLDEPTSGLDPSQIIEIRELIKEIGRERTVILSTHILPEVEVTCSRVLIISDGKIAASGTPRELQSVAGGEETVRVSIRAGAEGVEEKLRRIPSVAGVSRVAGPVAGPVAAPTTAPLTAPGAGPAAAGAAQPAYVTYLIKGRGGEDLGEQVFRAAVENRWMVNELRKETLSLEDIFLRLTTKEK